MEPSEIKLENISVAYLDGFNLTHLKPIQLYYNSTHIIKGSSIPKLINLENFRSIIGVLQSLVYPNSNKLDLPIKKRNEITFNFIVECKKLKYNIVTEKGILLEERYSLESSLIYEYKTGKSLYFIEDFYSDRVKEDIINNGSFLSLLSNLGTCFPSNKYYFHNLIRYIKNIQSLYIGFDKYVKNYAYGVLDWEKYLVEQDLIPQLKAIIQKHYTYCTVEYAYDSRNSMIYMINGLRDAYRLRDYLTRDIIQDIRKLIILDILSKNKVSLLIIDDLREGLIEGTEFCRALNKSGAQIVYPSY